MFGLVHLYMATDHTCILGGKGAAKRHSTGAPPPPSNFLSPCYLVSLFCVPLLLLLPFLYECVWVRLERLCL